MSIYYNEKTSEFHLQSLLTSYIIKINEFGHLVQIFYGVRLENRDSFASLDKSYSCETGSTVMYSYQPVYSMFHRLYEYPFYGKGDFREPAIDVTLKDGTHLIDLKYKSHQITEQKYAIKGLPSSIGKTQTLTITLADKPSGLEVDLHYAIFNEANVITRNCVIRNTSQDTIELNKVASLSFDHFSSDYEMITLDGAWVRERHISKHQLGSGVTYIDSKKGTSSADFNPFICLKAKNCDENSGECLGFSLVYSGNHRLSVEKNPFNLLRVQVGINPFDFKWYLKPGEEFATPEAIMTYSQHGLNKMSQNFHHFIKNNIVRGEYQHQERPILINNWEATYFKFNSAKIISLAKEAKKLGIELLVLDDGWFGHRNDDKSSLGDWFVNTKKIRGGLPALVKKVNEIGLKFGLWVEPEMISEDSELFKNHPDWAIKNPNHDVCLARNQMMLDLTNHQVIDYLYETLEKVFSSANIEYVKWDFNRNISHPYSPYLNFEQQGSYIHRYYLGYYELLERLVTRFPHILFESCASGGNRFDLGVLCFMPQIWCSDDQDPYERWKIQYGTSLLYPPSVIGAHVAAYTNHQIFRKSPIETRFNVAAFGLLGYELDLNALNKFEINCLKGQIQFYKQHRRLLQYGDFYRIDNPFESNQCTWMVVNLAQSQAIMGNYQALAIPYPPIDKLAVKGLNEHYNYHITNREQFANIKTFGNMINHVSPLKIKEEHLVQNVIDTFYMFKLERENIVASGSELMGYGFYPKHQFTGTGLNDDVRMMGDFGSRIYVFDKMEDE